MKKLYIFAALISTVVSVGCRNTGNPNDTGGSEVDGPVSSPYDSGHEPSNTGNTAVTDSKQADSTGNR